MTERTCGECAHFSGVCCDYGVCERDVRLASRSIIAEGDPRWVSAMRAISWAADNLVDAQDGACGRWEGEKWE